MKQTLDVTKQLPVVILCMAVLAILFQVIGIASSGWLVARFNLVNSEPNTERNNETTTESGMQTDNRLISPSPEPINRSHHDISRRMIPEKEITGLSDNETDGSINNKNKNIKPDTNIQDVLPNVIPDKDTSERPDKTKDVHVRPNQSMFRPLLQRPDNTRPLRPKPRPQLTTELPQRPDNTRPLRPKPRPQLTTKLPQRPDNTRPLRPKPRPQLPTKLPQRPDNTRPLRPKPRPQLTTMLPQRPDNKPIDNIGNVKPGDKQNPTNIIRPVHPRPRPNPSKTTHIDNGGKIIPGGTVTNKLPVHPNHRPGPPVPGQPKHPDIGENIRPEINDNFKPDNSNNNPPFHSMTRPFPSNLLTSLKKTGSHGNITREVSVNSDTDKANVSFPINSKARKLVPKPLPEQPQKPFVNGGKTIPDTAVKNVSGNGSVQSNSENRHTLKSSQNGGILGSTLSKNGDRKTSVTRRKPPKIPGQSGLWMNSRVSSVDTVGNIRIGLWVSVVCQVNISGDEKCTQHSYRDGLSILRPLIRGPLGYGWFDLKFLF